MKNLIITADQQIICEGCDITIGNGEKQVYELSDKSTLEIEAIKNDIRASKFDLKKANLRQLDEKTPVETISQPVDEKIRKPIAKGNKNV